MSSFKQKKTVLLTGASGFIGSYLLKTLLDKGYFVYALARNDNHKNFGGEILEKLNFWDPNTCETRRNNLLIIQGDITLKNLGLTKNTVSALRDNVSVVFHCAANTKFNDSKKKLTDSNVIGTENVLGFILGLSKNSNLIKVNHFSTAFICGNYHGKFFEKDLDKKQTFSTHYERTKFESEKIVKKFRNYGLWIDIFRPPAVVGESISGKTVFFNQAPYQALRLINTGLFDYFPISKNQMFYIVCVDELCKSIVHISETVNKKNQTYLPFPTKHLTIQKWMEISCKFLGLKKPTFISFDSFIKSKSTPAQRLLLQNNYFFLNNNVHLDSTLTNQTLEKKGFKYRKIDETIIKKLIKFAVLANFIKKPNFCRQPL